MEKYKKSQISSQPPIIQRKTSTFKFSTLLKSDSKSTAAEQTALSDLPKRTRTRQKSFLRKPSSLLTLRIKKEPFDFSAGAKEVDNEKETILFSILPPEGNDAVPKEKMPEDPFKLSKNIKYDEKNILEQNNRKTKYGTKKKSRILKVKEVLEKEEMAAGNIKKHETRPIQFLKTNEIIDLVASFLLSKETDRRRKGSIFFTEESIYKSKAKKLLKDMNEDINKLDDYLEKKYDLSLTIYYERIKEAAKIRVHRVNSIDQLFIDDILDELSDDGVSL
eukprot:snap_masked-scaffold_14-processed-gene-11.6-mRNA-1 protein AED:0.95 eAED:1.00 QI:0/-1/0/1/-1/1/1/0/276